jgi:sialidase-1
LTPDVGPAHNPAHVRGGATVALGKFGTGLALDGVDDRVEVPFDRSIDLGADDFTLMTWIKYGDTTGSHAILLAYRTGSGTTPQVWLRAEPEGKRIRALLAVDRFNITVQSASAYNDDQWHHVVLQRANGKLRLLVDGVEVGSATAPPGSVTAGKEFGVQGIHVGQRVDGVNRFHGTVDEVRVYRRALSDAELDQIRLTNKPDLTHSVSTSPSPRSTNSRRAKGNRGHHMGTSDIWSGVRTPEKVSAVPARAADRRPHPRIPDACQQTTAGRG